MMDANVPTARALRDHLDCLLRASELYPDAQLHRLLEVAVYQLSLQPDRAIVAALRRGLEALGGAGCWGLAGIPARELLRRARAALEAATLPVPTPEQEEEAALLVRRLWG